jgi:hypothetical protein
MKLHSNLPVYKSTYDLLLGYLNLLRVLVRNINIRCEIKKNKKNKITEKKTKIMKRLLHY